jgi:hypothetical protein
MYRLDREKNHLFFEGRKLEPRSVEENVVGFCSDCEGELWSIACYQLSEGWLVASRCDGCERMAISRYDPSWTWEGDFDLVVVAADPDQSAKEESQRSTPKTSTTSLSDIPREELETVFTPAELRDMERCEKGEAYTRQNLYRARAKYEKFERLFGVRIDI